VKRIVWRVDKILTEHWKSVDESQKRQDKLRKPPAVGGSR